jgi:hypothetical protein
MSATPTVLGGNSAGRVNDDGTFEMKVLPGKASVRMNATGPFANTRIRSVRLNGVDSVRDYTAVIFPRDRERWGFGSRYFNGGRPDQEGRYKAINLPPGKYYAIALDYVENGAGTDPEFLDRVKERAMEFSMTDAETKSLDSKLVTGT